jgi:hypothetical protein
MFPPPSDRRLPAGLAFILAITTLACGSSTPTKPNSPISSGGLGGSGPSLESDAAVPLAADAGPLPGDAALDGPRALDVGKALGLDASEDAPADGGTDLGTDGVADAGLDGSVDGRPLSTDLPTNVTLSLDPTEVSFQALVGTVGGPLELTLANGGTTATGTLTIELQGPAASDFTTTSQCPTSLDPGEFCAIQVSFAPQVTGTKEATLVVTGASGALATTQLTGLAAGGAAALRAAFVGLDLGPCALGIEQTTDINLTNIGGVSITSITGQSTDSAFTLATDGCADLAPAQDCFASVTFTATAVGPRSATLTFSGAPGGQASVTISATGIDAAVLNMLPEDQDFGAVAPGQTGGPVTFTVENDGSQATGTLSASLTGADPTSFAITGGTCAGQALGVGQSCTVTVVFKPADASARSATLMVEAAGGPSTASRLDGQGAVPRLQISPESVGYPPTTVNTESPPVEFLLTNAASDPSGPLTVSITSGSGVDFVKKADACTGVSLPAGGTCTLSVAFKPRTATGRNGTLTVSGGTMWTATASLQGVGQ